MKVLESKENKLSVLIEDTTYGIMNSIRRSVHEVPVLAVDEVEFIKNDSALFDEIVAHRIGLIPLKQEDLKEKSECNCDGKGCSKCTISLKLETKGQGIVYSSQLKGKADVIYDKIPITFLEKNQELKLNATAILGKGKEHAKFSPGLVYFRPLVSIDIKKECDGCEECVKICPLNILSIENKKIKVNDIEKCDSCEACVEVCRKKGKDCINLKPSDKDFIFVIESWGQMKPKEIFIQSIDALNKNLKQLNKAID